MRAACTAAASNAGAQQCLCAAYASGPPDSNSCLTNYAKITTMVGCQAATDFLLLKDKLGNPISVFGPIEDASSPSGCYYAPTTKSVKLNIAAVGTARSGATPICAGAYCIASPAHAAHPAAAFELA